MKIRVLILALLCAFLTGCASTMPTNTQGEMTCKFERNGDVVKILVTNTSVRNLYVANPFKMGWWSDGVPAFSHVKIIDNTGRVLTENPDMCDGYWTSLVMQSSLIDLPYKKMQKVRSGKSIAGTVELSKMLRGLRKEITIQDTDLVKLRIPIYLDSALEKSWVFEVEFLGDKQVSLISRRETTDWGEDQ